MEQGHPPAWESRAWMDVRWRGCRAFMRRHTSQCSPCCAAVSVHLTKHTNVHLGRGTHVATWPAHPRRIAYGCCAAIPALGLPRLAVMSVHCPRVLDGEPCSQFDDANVLIERLSIDLICSVNKSVDHRLLRRTLVVSRYFAKRFIHSDTIPSLLWWCRLLRGFRCQLYGGRADFDMAF